MAPPFTLTLSGSSSNLRTQYTHMEAKASLIYHHFTHELSFFVHVYCTSNRSTSSVVMPTFAKTLGMAMEGPMPIIRGAKPARGTQLTGRQPDATPLTCDSYVEIFCEDSKIKFVCLSSRHQQHGGSAVCDLTCVPSCRLRGEPVRESRLDF